MLLILEIFCALTPSRLLWPVSSILLLIATRLRRTLAVVLHHHIDLLFPFVGPSHGTFFFCLPAPCGALNPCPYGGKVGSTSDNDDEELDFYMGQIGESTLLCPRLSSLHASPPPSFFLFSFRARGSTGIPCSGARRGCKGTSRCRP